METPGYSERSDDEVSPPTAGGAQREDEPVQAPDDAGDEGGAADDVTAADQTGVPTGGEGHGR
jgi:hypothetical protein